MDVLKQVLQVPVGHAERHVTDKDGSRRRDSNFFSLNGATSILNDHFTTFQNLHVHARDSFHGVFGVAELDVTESVGKA